MHSFLVALAFLTTLPIRTDSFPAAAVLARSRFWFPVVGLLLGAGLGGAAWGLLQVPLAPGLRAFVLLAFWILLTGALHIDGFCDLCDGLFAGQSAADRLRILKDPHLGTFGLVGGVLLLLGKWTALTELLDRTPGRSPWLIALTVVAARCLVLVLAAGATYPRAEGTGKILVESCRGPEAFLFGGLAILVVILSAWWLDDYRLLMPLAVVLPALWLLRWVCVRQLGGITGDGLGASIELTELLWLLTAAGMT